MIGIGINLALGAQGGAGGGFVGAYDDTPSIAAAYGMRRLLSSYEGNLLRLRRDSDNAESDFGNVANGDLDAAAIATFLAATTGYVTTWYDQSGNGYNAVQTTAANQPLYVASGHNSKPVLRVDGTDDHLVIAAQLTVGAALAVALHDSATFPGYDGLFTGNGVGGSEYFFAGNGAGGSSSFQVGGEFGTSIWVNNVATVSFAPLPNMKVVVGVDATPITATGFFIGKDRAFTSREWDGDIAEIVVASAAWATGDRVAAQTAANAYWSLY
jgi:hypothetical protein